MKPLLNAFFIFNLLTSAVTRSINCKRIIRQRDSSVAFYCTELTGLTLLDKAYSNSTSIEITDSKIPQIPGHKFARFGATLVTLDLHGSGIETIDSWAFVGLERLENLLLWGNKLRHVYKDWFIGTPSLKTLDLSFNSIEVIYYDVSLQLPNLQNFYFDYNQLTDIPYTMFENLKNLKNVKFEKNPFNWGLRANLIWQLENQHVRYSDDWEDWKWMNVVIKECMDSGYGEVPQDKILDCAVEKLLNYAFDIYSANMEQPSNDCNSKARELVRCMRPKNGSGNTDNETARRVLEDYTAVLPTMFSFMSRFSMP